MELFSVCRDQKTRGWNSNMFQFRISKILFPKMNMVLVNSLIIMIVAVEEQVDFLGMVKKVNLKNVSSTKWKMIKGKWTKWTVIRIKLLHWIPLLLIKWPTMFWISQMGAPPAKQPIKKLLKQNKRLIKNLYNMICLVWTQRVFCFITPSHKIIILNQIETMFHPSKLILGSFTHQDHMLMVVLLLDLNCLK